MLRRLVGELRGRHAPSSAARARAALRISGDTIHVGGAGAVLGEAPPPTGCGAVVLAPGVLSSIPTRAARIALLEEVARLAPRVRVHAPLVGDGRLARLVIDPARRLLGTTAEPGDRFPETGFVHRYFDDEALLLEAGAAGLVSLGRDGSWLVLAPGSSDEIAVPFAEELASVAFTMPEAERLRHGSPAEAVTTMRRRGRGAPLRGPIGRARLRRAIGWVDAAYLVARPNCYRRVLTEIALDGGAARESLVFGLDVGRTGHVAFAGAEDVSFDVAFTIPPG